MMSDAMLKCGPLLSDLGLHCSDRLRQVGSGLSVLAIFTISWLSAQPTDSGLTLNPGQSNLIAGLNQRLVESRARLKEAELPGPLPPGETEQDRVMRRVLLSQLVQAYEGH